MAKKAKMSQEEIDRLIKEKLEEHDRKFKEEHTPWISLKYGNTYVGYNVYDYMTEEAMIRLEKLLELMNVKYSIRVPFSCDEDKSFYLLIKGEDKARADFIQKFFDSGYKLSW